MESSHRIEPNRDPPLLVQFCKSNMINFKSSYQAYGYLIEHKGQEHSRHYMQGCLCLSSGDCGSNVATSIRKVLRPVFEFFAIAGKERIKLEVHKNKLSTVSVLASGSSSSSRTNQANTTSSSSSSKSQLPLTVTQRFWKMQAKKLKTNNNNKSNTYSTEQKQTSNGNDARGSTSGGSSARDSSDNASVASWNPDCPNCELCETKFTLFNRRHHCRVCGRVVCDACSENRLFVPGKSPKDSKR